MKRDLLVILEFKRRVGGEATGVQRPSLLSRMDYYQDKAKVGYTSYVK